MLLGTLIKRATSAVGIPTRRVVRNVAKSLMPGVEGASSLVACSRHSLRTRSVRVTSAEKHTWVSKENHHRKISFRKRLLLEFLVDVSGLEPPTPCLQSRCSPS
jgi:hypothetical protein